MCALEDLYVFYFAGWSVLYVSVRSSYFIVLFKSPIPFSTLYLVPLSIIESSMVKYLSIVEFLLILASNLISLYVILSSVWCIYGQIIISSQWIGPFIITFIFISNYFLNFFPDALSLFSPVKILLYVC